MKDDATEALKVSFIGTGGFIASLTLQQVATLTSIGVGLATLVYILTKTFFLIKSGGRDKTS